MCRGTYVVHRDSLNPFSTDVSLRMQCSPSISFFWPVHSVIFQKNEIQTDSAAPFPGICVLWDGRYVFTPPETFETVSVASVESFRI